MRREFPYLLIIVIVALTVRIYAPWQAVLGGDYVNFLETDAWYHIRLIENQLRNWPWRVTVDPYAAAGGQFVPIAPFFDTMTSTVVLMLHGRDASVSQIERVAAFVPPVLGALAVAAVWALARVVFDFRAAVIAAALLAVTPGHFLDRTQLGFYDHHALEALLALTTLLAIALAMRAPAPWRVAPLAGLSLGLYLLAWSSGAFLLAILGGWLFLVVLLVSSPEDLLRAAQVTMVAAALALALVLLFQDRRMFRYESQVFGLFALGGMAAVLQLTARVKATLVRRTAAYVGSAIVLAAGLVLLGMSTSGGLAQFVTDIGRLGADPRRMGVLEARPLFLYSGQWDWAQPWVFFRGTFYVGLVALVLLSVRVMLERGATEALICVSAAAMFAATYGQNRFGYYLVPFCALLAGWLGSLVFAWRRDLASVGVAAVMFAPTIVPATLLESRQGSLPDYWRRAMVWLRDNTPPPFAIAGGENFYYAQYASTGAAPGYSVMNWWDHGYWIVQVARRVPVANPTQERAPNAARFYAATTEPEALATLVSEQSQYVISDWELPFRYTPQGAIMGRFQNVVDWAGRRHADYYEVMYRRVGGAWIPVWVFHEPYYRSMVFRLSVLGGEAAEPGVNASSVIVVEDRVDERGLRFKEILAETSYPTYETAVAAANVPRGTVRALIVGLDPWRAAFPVERLAGLREVHAVRTREQPSSESPWVRVFRVGR